MDPISRRPDVRKLVGELESPDVETRSSAARSLGLAGDARAVAELMAHLKNDESPLVRSAAALGLATLGATSAYPALLSGIANDPEEDVRVWCMHALAGLGEQSEATEQTLLEVLRSGSTRERAAAAYALGMSGNSSVAQHLVPLLHEKSWFLRFAACAALTELGVSHQDLIPTLEALSTASPSEMQDAPGAEPEPYEVYARAAEHLLEVARGKFL